MIFLTFKFFSDDDCNPIEQEEWLAFMRSNMNEVMEGDVESLMQQNIVSLSLIIYFYIVVLFSINVCVYRLV